MLFNLNLLYMKKIALLLAFFAIGLQVLMAQTKEISGRVTSADDGGVIPGVSVSVKGTTLGTITDMDGVFRLKVPQDAKNLVFSFVGMQTQEVAITGQKNINVKLTSENINVDEVVVTALGITREKKSLGFAVQDVKGNEVTKGGNPDFITSLQGKVAGLEIRQSSGMPGAPASILIRGARSFSGNNAPLYVVDGMPISSDNDYAQGSGGTAGSAYSNRALDIDPNDIESINVLKGQAAAALYGMRASNGVIVITTKSGRNAAKGKPVITFNTNTSVDQISRLPELQMKYAQGTYESWSTASSYSWGPLISDLPTMTDFGGIYGGNANGHQGKWFDPSKNAWVDPVAYNNGKNFFENGVTLNNNINISQAFENGNYSIGLGSTNQTGIVSGTGLNRYNAKIAGNYNVNKKVTVGFSGNYSDDQLNKLPSGNDSYLFTVFGAPPNYDLMGSYSHAPSGPLNEYRQVSYRRGAVGDNPIWATEHNKYTEATKRFFGNTYLEYKPVNWIKAKYQLGIDSYTTDYEDYIEMGSAKTGQSLPTRTQYPTPANPAFAYVEPTGGSMEYYGITKRVLNSLFTITFDKKLTEDIHGTLLLGNEINDEYSNSYDMLGTGFTIPGWDNLANTSTQLTSNSKYRYRTVGNFGNLSLDYKSLLFLNLTGRVDRVSQMPKGNRTFFYPSASLGFLFTELSGLKDNEILSYGKLRASYAEVGQAGSFHPVTFIQSGAGSGFLDDGLKFPLGGLTGYEPNSILYDPALKPMNTQSYELGAELKFFNNRVGIDYTYSHQVSKDQIFKVPLAGSTGYSDLYMNAGEMKSVSHDVILTITPIKTSNFEWIANINFSKVKSTCISLADGVDNISLGGYEEPNIRASAGSTYPVIFGNRFARDDQGRVLVDEDPNSDTYGMPYQGEFGKLADVAPKFILGVNNSIRFKFITLSALIDWKNGGHMYSGSNRLIDLYGTSKRTEDRTSTFIIDGYKSNGSKNDIVRGGASDPDAYFNLYASVYSDISEANIYETSYLKLRTVSLAFDLPKSLISPLHLQSASLSFSARNILLWTSLPNFDPESSQGQGNMQGGMDYMSLPQTKSFGVGLNLVF
jgi:TonB-linked SusC/RagA family outer membrane protein